MTLPIRIKTGGIDLAAELNDSATAQAVAAALPVSGNANCWGDEIYFSIPVNEPEADDARADMDVGELAYWPPGNAFCILFGPTPMSSGDKPRMASPSNPLGKVTGDATVLRQVKNGAKVTIERA